MNKVILVGNLGADGELKVLANDNAVLNFRLATTETWKNAEGVKQEKTEWHSCALWGPRAKGLAAHLVKGTKLVVEGSIETRTYEKDGEKRYATSIKVREVEFAGGTKNGGGQRQSSDSNDSEPPADDAPGAANVTDEELPF